MSTRTVQVDVTEDDIYHGVRGDPCCCPVARALARAFPAVQVEVAPLVLRIGGQRITAPGEVVGFVSAFDDFFLPDPGPFSFGLQWDEAAGRWAAA